MKRLCVGGGLCCDGKFNAKSTTRLDGHPGRVYKRVFVDDNLSRFIHAINRFNSIVSR
jgi:hypothetical protein